MKNKVKRGWSIDKMLGRAANIAAILVCIVTLHGHVMPIAHQPRP